VSQPHQPSTGSKKRVLFIGEAVTLAHVTRPFVLASGLDPDRFEVFFACAPQYKNLLGCLPFGWRPIHSISPEQFLTALARGKPVYNAETLRRYVQEDLSLLQDLSPDLVVGDFRISLAVSAPLSKTCYLALSNAYWSPYARQRFPLPELPFVRFLGVPLAKVIFRLARPIAFALHTLPLNRVRREYGLPRLGFDLRRIYTHADYTLYADVPELIPTYNLPPHHQYLGPILWSPAVAYPDWWHQVPADRPVVYVTLGSSGASHLLPLVLQALAEKHLTVMAATAGRIQPDRVPANALVAEYLPGQGAAQRADLVICNGGSPTTHQALAAGKPVLGIAGNMDQHLNMAGIVKGGAGKLLRAGKARPRAVAATVDQLLGGPAFSEAARKFARIFSTYQPCTRFQELVNEICTRR
jgi:UDP:flavonoid glycosyltransferase YjiC (YdhE family)